MRKFQGVSHARVLGSKVGIGNVIAMNIFTILEQIKPLVPSQLARPAMQQGIASGLHSSSI